MPREQSYSAIILRKQPLGEADEIITFLTEDSGKLRGRAKSVKLPGSRLQQVLQPIFLNRVQLAGSGNLPKVIGAQTINSFPVLQADPDRVKVWFVMAELLNKALPDEQPNQQLFELVRQYLEFLNSPQLSETVLATSLIKFKINLMETIGLQIHAPSAGDDQTGILFSVNRGGFYIGQPASDSRPVSTTAWQLFNHLRTISFSEITGQQGEIDRLQELVNSFIAYQLEREIKSEKFLE